MPCNMIHAVDRYLDTITCRTRALAAINSYVYFAIDTLVKIGAILLPTCVHVLLSLPNSTRKLGTHLFGSNEMQKDHTEWRAMQ
jgi:hypothetical protein